jgi:hypothetical protein
MHKQLQNNVKSARTCLDIEFYRNKKEETLGLKLASN